jgi:hypothetical protein
VYRRLGGTKAAQEEQRIIIFSTANEMKIIKTEGIFVHQRIAPTVKKVEFLNVRVSYIGLRDRWNNILLNVYAPS